MKDEDFEKLLESAKWMADREAGKKVTGGRVHTIDALDVKKIRAATKLSQSELGRVMNVPVKTLQKWEQGQRRPSGAARSLLMAIKNDPKNVIRAIQGTGKTAA